jgi:hypothetical protein
MESRKNLQRRKLLLLTLTAAILHGAKQRKRRSCWQHEWLSRRQILSFPASLVRELETEFSEFRLMFRMEMGTFNSLLRLIEPLITKQDTHLRMSITAREKLMVTLRYLATGM